MIWLARAWLDYETIARQQIRDCYDWHQRAWAVFPGRPERYPRPFLFRLRESGEGCEFLLLCREEPTRPGWIGPSEWAVKTVADSFLSHPCYHFDLLANPTRRHDQRDRWGGRERIRGKHRRFNLTSVEEQCEWIYRKAGQHGFRVLEDPGEGLALVIDPRRDFRFSRRDGPRGLHVGVRYQGCLEVTNPAEFAKAFKQGIGSAKGFGFGMLLLQPIKTSFFI